MSLSTMYGMSAPSALSQGNRRSDYADPMWDFMLEIRGGPELLGNSRGRGIVPQDMRPVIAQSSKRAPASRRAPRRAGVLGNSHPSTLAPASLPIASLRLRLEGRPSAPGH